MIYSINQWLLFFYIYCLAGWIWESSYVSIKEFIKKKEFKFINRGFLHGPWVPIYGSAAIIILISIISTLFLSFLIFLPIIATLALQEFISDILLLLYKKIFNRTEINDKVIYIVTTIVYVYTLIFNYHFLKQQI